MWILFKFSLTYYYIKVWYMKLMIRVLLVKDKDYQHGGKTYAFANIMT